MRAAVILRDREPRDCRSRSNSGGKHPLSTTRLPATTTPSGHRLRRGRPMSVVMKLSKALGGEPGRYQRSLEVGAGTGYFTIKPAACRSDDGSDRDRHLSGMLDMLAATAERLGLEVDTVSGDARTASVRGRDVRSGARARRPPPPAGSRDCVLRVRARCSLPGGNGRVHGVSRLGTATRSRDAQTSRRTCSAGVAAAGGRRTP